jgi:hypothetical protein
MTDKEMSGFVAGLCFVIVGVLLAIAVAQMLLR